MGRILTLFILFLSFQPIFAQLEKNYTPAKWQDTVPSDVHSKLKAKLEKDRSSVTEGKSNVKDFTKELYEKRTDFVIDNFNSDQFLLDTEFTPYLQKILAQIYSSNPKFPNESTVYAYRSEVPNAMSFGEGTIGFTLGLLSRLETEDQIAFVLCHELAHYHAKHSDDKLKEFARLNYDKEIRKKVRSIKRSEYGTYTKLKELSSSLELSITKHSRDKEFEADSLALLMFINTRYSLQAPVQTLDILDKSDKGLYPENIDFKKFFSFPDYPFKAQWISYEKKESLHVDKQNDSTATHPKCKQRIAAIKRQLARIKPSTDKRLAPAKNQMKEKSLFEIAESEYRFKDYGRALFNALILSNRYPKNIYAHAMIAKCMYQLYAYQKRHELGKVIVMPDPRFDENYDRFLTFIHTLRLMEIASLSYQYALAKKSECKSDEEFLYAYWLCSSTEVSKDTPAEIKTQYQTRFPSGKYLTMMD